MKTGRPEYDAVLDPEGKVFGKDEPVFVTRARDRAAQALPGVWVVLHRALGGDEETAVFALDQGREMAEWALKNPTHLADLPRAVGEEPAGMVRPGGVTYASVEDATTYRIAVERDGRVAGLTLKPAAAGPLEKVVEELTDVELQVIMAKAAMGEGDFSRSRFQDVVAEAERRGVEPFAMIHTFDGKLLANCTDEELDMARPYAKGEGLVALEAEKTRRMSETLITKTETVGALGASVTTYSSTLDLTAGHVRSKWPGAEVHTTGFAQMVDDDHSAELPRPHYVKLREPIPNDVVVEHDVKVSPGLAALYDEMGDKVTIRLVDKHGALVHETLIPPFKALPDVITWGDRHFTPAPFERKEVYGEVFGMELIDLEQSGIETAFRPSGGSPLSRAQPDQPAEPAKRPVFGGMFSMSGNTASPTQLSLVNDGFVVTKTTIATPDFWQISLTGTDTALYCHGELFEAWAAASIWRQEGLDAASRYVCNLTPPG
jgi:hypothetical protein